MGIGVLILAIMLIVVASQAALLTESQHRAEFIYSEAPGDFSRDTITLVSGQANLKAGTILGRYNTAGVVVNAAVAGNTGNGTMGTITLSAGFKTGVYRIVFTAATVFIVEDPDGVLVGQGATGTVFTKSGLSFTITAGGTAFVVGDQWTITVDATTTKWTAVDPAAVNGAQYAAGLLIDNVDATAGDVVCAALTRNAEVNKAELIFSSAITYSADQKIIIYDQLDRRAGIRARAGV